jgi:hypothetical protein
VRSTNAVSSAAARSRLPDCSRPMISSQLVRASVSKSRPTSRCITSGTQTSTGDPTSVPLNPRPATPTMVNVWLFSRIPRPSTAGSAAKLRRQKPSLITATGWAPGVRSSSGVSGRPI